MNTKGLKKGTQEARAEIATLAASARDDLSLGLDAAHVASANLAAALKALAGGAAELTGFNAAGDAIATAFAPAHAAIQGFAGAAKTRLEGAGKSAAAALAPLANAGRSARDAIATAFAPALTRARNATSALSVVTSPAAIAVGKFGEAGGKVARLGLAKTFGGLRSAVNGLGGPLAIAAGGLAAIAVAGAGAALASSAKGAWDNASALEKTAGRVGTTTEALAGLQTAYKRAGLDAGGLEGQLGKLGTKLNDAATGSGPAAAALDKMGLSASSLASMDRADAFRAIAQGISEIANPAEQAAAASALFEEEGIGLLDVLKGGAAGLDSAADAAKRYGLALNSADADAIANANAAIAETKLALEGVGTQLATAVAPYLAAAAKALADWAGQGTNAGDLIGGALEFVAKGAAFAADTVDTLRETFKAVQATATGAIASILEGVAELASGLEAVLSKIPGVEVSFGDTVSAMAQDMRQLADTQWAEYQKDAASDAGDVLAATIAKIKAEAAAARAEAAGKPAPVAAFTPPPTPAAAVIEKATQARQEKTAKSEKEKPAPAERDTGPRFAGAMELGSAEARSAILAGRGMLTAGDPGKATEANTKATAATLAAHTPLLASIAASLKKPQWSMVDDF